MRTPAMINWPGHVPAGQRSNEVVHITDMFTTLLLWAGLDVPKDRVIDGVDQRPFFEGRQAASNRDGFPFWLGETLYGVKWRNFKLVMVKQATLTDPALAPPKQRCALDREHWPGFTGGTDALSGVRRPCYRTRPDVLAVP